MTQATTPDLLRYAAFTDDPAGGNPAGVVLDASGLDDAAMLAEAARVGYSETAFVTEADHARRRYRLRYFSPLAEVAFCGHATVATAAALAERIGPGPLWCETRAGGIGVETAVDASGPRATLTSVETASAPASPADVETALAALGWAAADLDPALPPHVSFGGNNHLVLAAGSRARLAALDYDFDALAALCRARSWTTVHLVARDQDDPATFHVRAPFPTGGVVEDPATGAAAAAFGGYLRALGLVTEPTRFRLRQGEDMGRPSLLLLDLAPDDARSRVTGRAVRIPG
ncbi:PhzF family phenazine biosynthesis isomerase [Streptomyces sedi]|uniref:PhzF family phenazine biosynthesis protein n=1 Tax=Streptomyces sedi TaxID=555059 RepID=A0A5C4V854_9ACTN|nr:PhzF family phenazine biosynthesis isomerase [Streptomyces sedi]TNM32152.1 PhzF family phenazine biosynthesis protein [Streptomyces sedi]